MIGKFSSAAASPLYEIGFVNGPRGVTTRPSSGLPVNVKIGAPLGGDLFISGSYFNTGELGSADRSAISVAEISDAPAGAAEWKRTLWEVDARYNYGPTGIRGGIPSSEIPNLMLGATYGRFDDSASGASDREGNYWFVEGLRNITPRLYAAARYSETSLRGGALGLLGRSPVPVNEYRRTSFGLGYRLSNLTDLKTEYSINKTSGGASIPSLNQWAVGVASKF